jgi:hypothetical protein
VVDVLDTVSCIADHCLLQQLLLKWTGYRLDCRYLQTGASLPTFQSTDLWNTGQLIPVFTAQKAAIFVLTAVRTSNHRPSNCRLQDHSKIVRVATRTAESRRVKTTENSQSSKASSELLVIWIGGRGVSFRRLEACNLMMATVLVFRIKMLRNLERWQKSRVFCKTWAVEMKMYVYLICR